MRYYAKIKRQREGGFLVEFPGLRGCLTEGDSLREALKNAKEALNGWLASYCDRKMDVAQPKRVSDKTLYPIEVDLNVEFAIKLRWLRKKLGFSQSEVARKLGISQQAYAKLEAPDTANPSLSTIQKLSDALDVEIDLRLVA